MREKGIIRKVMLLSVLAWCFTCCLEIQEAKAAATGINVNVHSQDEIREYIKTKKINLNEEVSFIDEPQLSEPYNPGELSDATQQSALNTLNAVRYIAGINDNVQLNNDYKVKAQAAALVNAVNQDLSHTPNQPTGMDDTLFNLGCAGAGSSNLAYTSGMGAKLNDQIINAWMKDEDEYNIDRLGHRRWVINPTMNATGFGAVKDGRKTYSAMYSFDKNGAGGYQGVAWPAQNMPVNYFDKDFPWSISMGTAVTKNNIQVTLVRKRDDKKWTFSSASADGYFNVDNEGYGQTGCIIFRPNDVASYAEDDVFEVTITGTPQGSVSYTVSFFEIYAVTSLALDKTNITLNERGNTQVLTPIINPDATNKKVTWSTSDDRVASVSTNGVVTPLAAGTATITVTSVSGKKIATCSVTVEHVPGVAATCSTPQICTVCQTHLVESVPHTYDAVYTVDTEATCTQRGSESKHCVNYTTCHASADSRTIELKAHNNQSVVTEPTCTEEGFTTNTCDDCGYTEIVDTTATLGHQYETVITQPTCVAGGYTTDTCKVCSTVVTKDETEKLSHTYDSNYTVDTAATCTQTGTESKHCANYTACHAFTDTRTIALKAHNNQSIVTEPTCTEEGFTTNTCDDCGHTEIVDTTAALGHQYETVITQPTCVAGGYTTDTCKVCSTVVTKDETGKSSHTYASDYTVDTAATCTQMGTESKHCENYDVCHASADSRTIELKPHNNQSVVTDPTCTNEGYTINTCKDCGSTEKVNITNATGHKYEDDYTIDKKATCTETGNKSRHCNNKDCNTVTDSVQIAALGHTYRSVVTKPTYTTQGYTLHTCLICNKSYKDTITAVLKKPVPQVGKTYTDSNQYYKILSNSQVEFSGMKNTKITSIKIPDTVTIEGTKLKVASIATKAFKGNKKLKTVTIGNNITTIGNNAFEGCTSVTKVTIGKGVQTIGAKAFYNCKALKTITIQSSKLNKIGKNAFGKTHEKVVVKVPKSKLTAYKKLLKGKGLGKKAQIKK